MTQLQRAMRIFERMVRLSDADNPAFEVSLGIIEDTLGLTTRPPVSDPGKPWGNRSRWTDEQVAEILEGGPYKPAFPNRLRPMEGQV